MHACRSTLEDPTVSHDDAANSVFAWVRRGHEVGSLVLVVCNFTPTVRHAFRVGVPQAGEWRERLNTDSAHYGGSNVGSSGAATAEWIPWHGKPYSIQLTLPPLATVFFEWNERWSR